MGTATAVRGLDIQGPVEVWKARPAPPSTRPAARAQVVRIQGRAPLAAIVSRPGEIQERKTKSGRPLPEPAAIEAVNQWRYRPFPLNGEAAKADNSITATFQLS